MSNLTAALGLLGMEMLIGGGRVSFEPFLLGIGGPGGKTFCCRRREAFTVAFSAGIENTEVAESVLSSPTTAVMALVTFIVASIEVAEMFWKERMRL